MSTGGFSEARLERTHEVMAAHVMRGEAPGIVSLVSRRGEVHVDDTVPAHRPMTVRDVLTFRLGPGRTACGATIDLAVRRGPGCR